VVSQAIVEPHMYDIVKIINIDLSRKRAL